MSKVSVIMGIYNCGDTLGKSIDSILAQTYKDWELIMCDDGSIDNTYEVACAYRDKYPDKIILIKNEKNLGLNATLNKCLKYARGKYVARMDGDDLCRDDRFEKEVHFLEENPDFDIVSTNMLYFDENGIFAKSQMKEFPEKEDFMRGTPFCHAPCMVTKKAYDSVCGYTEDKRLLRVEDYNLWTKMYAKGYRGYNIQEPLYSMRDDRLAAKRRAFKYRINEAYAIYLAVVHLKLKKRYAVYIFKPIVVGMLPKQLYLYMHKRKREV